jgi:hypothetical protein
MAGMQMGGQSSVRRRVVWGAIVLLAVLHQDFWWRADHRTLVFGFLPVSLAYHVAVSIAASILWGLACYHCWPRDVDVLDEPGSPAGGARPGAHD